MGKIVNHHGVDFELDVADWSDQDSSQIAENRLEDGVLSLSELQVKELATAWADADDEAESRNKGDAIAEQIEALENTAFYAAIEGWYKHPESGHNCGISLFRE